MLFTHYFQQRHNVFKYLQYALGRDGLGDRTGDGLRGVDESFLTRHALLDVSAEKSLHDGVDGTEKDATLTVDIRLKVVSVNDF